MSKAFWKALDAKAAHSFVLPVVLLGLLFHQEHQVQRVIQELRLGSLKAEHWGIQTALNLKCLELLVAKLTYIDRFFAFLEEYSMIASENPAPCKKDLSLL